MVLSCCWAIHSGRTLVAPSHHARYFIQNLGLFEAELELFNKISGSLCSKIPGLEQSFETDFITQLNTLHTG
jgi:hypothetical protein